MTTTRTIAADLRPGQVITVNPERPHVERGQAMLVKKTSADGVNVTLHFSQVDDLRPVTFRDVNPVTVFHVVTP